MVTVYLFDFDDTLIDSKIYATLYRPLLEKITKTLGIKEEELEQKLLALGLKKTRSGRWDTGDVCREFGLLDLYYTELEKFISVSSVIHDETKTVLKKIKKSGRRVGIVSNSMRRTIALYLRKYRLNPYIDFIFSQDDAGCRKSSKEFWKKLIEIERLNPSECIVIGDHEEEDVAMPKKLGFSAFHLKNTKDLVKVLEF